MSSGRPAKLTQVSGSWCNGTAQFHTAVRYVRARGRTTTKTRDMESRARTNTEAQRKHIQDDTAEVCAHDPETLSGRGTRTIIRSAQRRLTGNIQTNTRQLDRQGRSGQARTGQNRTGQDETKDQGLTTKDQKRDAKERARTKGPGQITKNQGPRTKDRGPRIRDKRTQD